MATLRDQWWYKACQSGYFRRRGDVPEYPEAVCFVPAAPTNFRRANRQATDVDKIVVHITGGTRLVPVVNTFSARTNSDRTSAHYIVARNGGVWQMVYEKDIANHAGPANSSSIGIEHVARRDSPPTSSQYLASAKLVLYLVQKYNVPIDRSHIRGHAEVHPTTGHSNCPSAAWDWARYMTLLNYVAWWSIMPALFQDFFPDPEEFG